MVKFYLNRIAGKLPEERQAYLNETVPAKFRDQVKEAWNQAHPEEELK